MILNTGSTWDSRRHVRRIARHREFEPGGAAGLLGIGLNGGNAEGPSNGTFTNLGNSLVTQSFNSTVYQADDTVSLTRGRHNFKFGGLLQYDAIKVFYSGNSGELGNIVFGPDYTSSAAPAPLPILGAAARISSWACRRHLVAA